MLCSVHTLILAKSSASFIPAGSGSANNITKVSIKKISNSLDINRIGIKTGCTLFFFHVCIVNLAEVVFL
jgi:hypothetical protein